VDWFCWWRQGTMGGGTEGHHDLSDHCPCGANPHRPPEGILLLS